MYIGNPPNIGYGLKIKRKLHEYIRPSLVYIIDPTSTVNHQYIQNLIIFNLLPTSQR